MYSSLNSLRLENQMVLNVMCIITKKQQHKYFFLIIGIAIDTRWSMTDVWLDASLGGQELNWNEMVFSFFGNLQNVVLSHKSRNVHPYGIQYSPGMLLMHLGRSIRGDNNSVNPIIKCN